MLSEHADTDRAEFGRNREAVNKLFTRLDRFDGAIFVLKWLVAPSTIIAAAGLLIDIIHRWGKP